MRTVLVRLEAPLQSWGYRARWDQRDTGMEPTKSGVIGLVAAALGVERGDDATLRQLTTLRLGVRVDRQGQVIEDLHTVGSGVRDARGDLAMGKDDTNRTVLSVRQYLADASFLAALQGGDALVAAVVAALQRPRWLPFLGRRSCPPAVPLLVGEGDYGSLVAALEDWPAAAGVTQRRFRAVLDVAPSQGNPRHDVPQSFRLRTFGVRYVEERTVVLRDAMEDQC